MASNEHFSGDTGNAQLGAFRDRHLTPVFLKSRSDVVDYFKDTFSGRDKRGNENWKPQAAMAIAGTTDKKSTEYKTAMRQFQFDKRTGQERYLGAKQTHATQARYEAVGRALPPATYKIPNELTITVKGMQGQRERAIPTVTLKGVELYQWMKNPDYETIFDKAGYRKAYAAMSGSNGDSGALLVTSIS